MKPNFNGPYALVENYILDYEKAEMYEKLGLDDSSYYEPSTACYDLRDVAGVEAVTIPVEGGFTSAVNLLFVSGYGAVVNCDFETMITQWMIIKGQANFDEFFEEDE